MIDNLKLIDSHLMSYMISHWIKMRIYFWKLLINFLLHGVCMACVEGQEMRE
jgi:hypothetical protein